MYYNYPLFGDQRQTKQNGVDCEQGFLSLHRNEGLYIISLKSKYKLMTKSFLPDMYEPAYMRRKESKQNMIMYMCYILLVLLQYVVYCGKSDKLNTRKIVSLSLLTSILKLNASNGLALTAIQEINKSPTVDQVPNVRAFS